MKVSADRIITTHVGSLPRPDDLAQIVAGRSQSEIRADPAVQARVAPAVEDVVRRQDAAGIDVINDGEVSRASFTTFISERVSGLDGPPQPQPAWIEESLFPEFYKAYAPAVRVTPICNGPVSWRGDTYVKADIANLRKAAAKTKAVETFMSTVSPGQVSYTFTNKHYKTDEEYLFAIAEALRPEYKAIVDAGVILQLDSPQLAMFWSLQTFADASVESYRKFIAMHVEATNHALVGIPSDRVRMHVCWGNTERPHVRDIPLDDFIDLVYRVNADGITFESSNPRHGHEWTVFENRRPPENKILIPGAIDTLTNFVEHPELVAQRIELYARLVGKERVIAGTDCGFSTMVRSQPRVHPTIAWAKLEALAEGANIASRHLWRTAPRKKAV